MRVLLLLPLLLAADWPRFRGPNGSGVAEAELPAKWDDGVLFKVSVPPGYGSPIVAHGTVYLQTASADASQRSLLSLDAATGKTRWTAKLPGGPGHTHKKNSLASGTPAADAERIYVVSWDGDALTLSAVNKDGSAAWSSGIGRFKSQHGAGHSPMVHAGKVFVNYDQDDDAELVAFDAATGKKAWTAKRKAFRSCYSTPLLRELPGGKFEVIVSSTAGVAGYDPDTGKELWAWAWRFDGMALRTVASPILVGEFLIACSGDGGGSRSTVCLRPGSASPFVWETKKNAPYVPAPVAKGDYLYWVTDAGIAMCVEAKTGRVRWNERATALGVSASLILVGDAVFAVGEDGQVVSFRADPTNFEKADVFALNETTYATPAVANGKLYLRGAKSLVCIGKK